MKQSCNSIDAEGIHLPVRVRNSRTETPSYTSQLLAFHVLPLREHATNPPSATSSYSHDTCTSTPPPIMDPYQITFIGLVALNTFLFTRQHRSRPPPPPPPNPSTPALEKTDSTAIQSFETNFLTVYLLAVAADWMQGPHIYALYKYEKSLPERTVAALYAAGFISGAISASFAGSLADRHGRRLACLVYCGTYTLSCLSTLSSSVIVLMMGRIFGGVSTTLLFSVFETWMLADYAARGPSLSGLDLSRVFGRMTTLGSVVAILVGVLGDMLVAWSGSRTTPFLASICFLALAAVVMVRRWDENYGASAEQPTSTSNSTSTSTKSLLHSPQLLALALTSTVFEGTMYLFIFFWSALSNPHVYVLIRP
jgi:MFS family permease